MEKKRNRVPVNGWLVPGKHDVLIDRWNSVPDGERTAVLIAALEHYFNLPPSKRRDPLYQIREDTTWIRRALEDLPGYLENLLGTMETKNPGESKPPQEIEDELARERDKMMKQNRW